MSEKVTGSSSTLTMIPDWATFGTVDATKQVDDLPTITEFVPDALPIEGARLIQVVSEVPRGSTAGMLPSALAPVSPAFMSWRGLFLPETPWGPTTIAETRILCRAGFRPRVYLLDAKTDNPDALEPLRSRWGYRIETAEKVSLRRYHDATQLEVVDNGVTTLSLEAVQPTTTSGTAFGMNASIHLANTPIGPKLVQVGIDYTFTRAEICRPKIRTFVPSAWRAEGLDSTYPVSAISGVADIELREIKFATDLDKPALFGTQPVNVPVSSNGGEG